MRARPHPEIETPQAMRELLRGPGFTQVSEVSVEETDARFFQGRSDDLRVAHFERLAFAR